MAEHTYHEAAAHEARDLPVMLPGKLVGRDKTLAAVYGELKQNRPVLLHGRAGIGKTAIAATLASAYTQQPGGALWLRVDGDPLAQLIVRVGRAYGDLELANTRTPTAMIGAATTLLAQNKPLVVLDGAPMLPASREFVNKLAPGLPVMVISTDGAEGDWTSVEVPALEPADASTLFAEKSGLSTPEVAEIVALLEHLPLAVLVAAGTARIAKLDAAALLAALQGTTETDPVRRSLQVGFSRLQQGLQGVLLILGATFNGSASLDMLTMLSGAQRDTVKKVMTILAASGYVQQDTRYGSPYYDLHPEVHEYASRFLASSGRLGPLQEKARDTVVAYAKQYSGGSDDDHDRLAVEMETFLATAHWAAENGENDVASQIVVALSQAEGFISGRGYLYELLQLQDSGSSGMSAFPANAELPPEAAVPAPEDDMELFDDEDEGYEDDPDFLDDANFDRDEDEALSPEDMMSSPEDMTNPDNIRVAVMDARGAGDSERELELQEKLGALLVSSGKGDEALAVYNELLLNYEDDDDDEQIMATRLKLARLMVSLESPQAALLHATQGSRLAEELADANAHTEFLILQGDARQLLGESIDAIVAYSHALDIATKQDDKDKQASAQMKLGFAQLDDDDAETAIKTWEAGLELCKALGKRDCEGRILGGLGTAYGELERWAEATNFHTSALYIAREVGDKKEEALQLSNLGYAAKAANNLGDAVLRYRQALHLAYANDERENIVSNIVDLARILSTSPMHLDIADMLVNDALTRDPTDREVLDLKQSITSGRMQAVANDVEMRPVKGTAQEYASSAYSLLDA
jgi:tetratricopeptide (TPR) repeat protein/energy-coupling factor transporter ATP-binding protein EcfA2